MNGKDLSTPGFEGLLGKTHWRCWPLLPWAVGFALGLLRDGAPGPVLVLAALVALWAWPLGRRWAIPLVFLCLGYSLGTLRQPDAVRISPEHPVAVSGWVFSHPELSDPDRVRFVLKVDYVQQRGHERSASLDVWVHAPMEIAEQVRLGRRIRLRGYVRRSSSARNLRPATQGPWWMTLESPRFFELSEPEPRWLRPGLELRRPVADLLGRWPGPGAALAQALILGDRSRLPDTWKRTARATGTAHLLAVSGLHVGILAFFIYGLAAPLPRGLRLGATALAMVLFGIMIGPRAAAARAIVMALWVISTLALRRPPLGLQSLAGSVLLMLWLHPHWIDDLGFRLSTVATGALIAVAPTLVQRWARWWPDGVASKALLWSLAASVCAQLATAPALWPVTGLAHPQAPVLNVMAVPWLVVTLTVAWGLTVALVVCSMVFPASLDGAFRVASIPMDSLTLPVEALVAAGEPWLGWPVSLGPWQALALASVALALLLWGRRGVLLLMLVLIGWVLYDGRQPSDSREVIFLDVGQGDAVLLRSYGRNILVDGGGWRRGDIAGRVLVPALADLGVRRLHALVLTHGDRDHCGGLADLRSYLPVDEIWASPGWTGTCPVELLGHRGARWRPLYAGMERQDAGWMFDVLWPEAGDRRRGNGRSLVLRVSGGGRSILLTGDLEAADEQRLLRQGRVPKVDVLKVAHHGSKSSTTDRYLRAVSPRLAVISAGRHNRFGHPHPSVVERLQAHGAVVLRTDHHGVIRLAWTEGPARPPMRIELLSPSGELPSPSGGPPG